MRIGVLGCAGRMGRMVVREVLAHPDAELVGAACAPGDDAVGQDAGLVAGQAHPVGVVVDDDPVNLFTAADAVIDFTSPEATVQCSAYAAQAKAAHIIGTTGLSADQEERLQRAAAHTAIVYAANMSLGVNLLIALVEEVSRILRDDFDIEVLEMHHRNKVDAPSGTALALGRAAAHAREVMLADHAVRSRDGHTGARRPGDIGFATLRGGDVVGDHTVLFAGPGERIELTHKAANREIFAKGALKAALWTHGHPPGLYTMRDVLGI